MKPSKHLAKKNKKKKTWFKQVWLSAVDWLRQPINYCGIHHHAPMIGHVAEIPHAWISTNANASINPIPWV